MKREINIIARTRANWYWKQDTWKYHFWMMIVNLTDERKNKYED